MSIGAIWHGYSYQNTYSSRTVILPAPVCQSKMRDFGDELIISEKNDGDNDVYRNAFVDASTSGTIKSYCSGVVNLSSLVTGTNENNHFIGSLFILKIENEDGLEAKPDENYTLKFV